MIPPLGRSYFRRISFLSPSLATYTSITGKFSMLCNESSLPTRVVKRDDSVSPGEPKMDVLVYDDEGVGQHALQHILWTFKSLLSSHYAVKTINANQLLSEPWINTTVLFVMPGGRDIPYLTNLTKPMSGITGNDVIRKFVFNGGKYLGICAGAYYAASQLEFERGRPDYEIIQDREKMNGLCLFQGTAQGSVAQKFNYDYCKTNETIVSVNTQTGSIDMYLNGGCRFLPRHPNSIVVHGTYEDDTIAICEAPYQNGTVILSGVHIEIDPFYYVITQKQHRPERPISEKFLNRLQASNQARISFLKYLLNDRLKMSVNSEANDPAHYVLFSTHHSHPIFSTLTATPFDEADIGMQSQLPYSTNIVNISLESTYFDRSIYFSHLRTSSSIGHTLLHASSTTSTQTLLDHHKSLRAVPHGFVFSADAQCAARGRGRNTWINSRGMLQFSLCIFHPLLKNTLVFIQYLMGMAVVSALQEIDKKMVIKLKWPNDIYAQKQEGGPFVKIGGVLVTSSCSDQIRVVIGCGLNIFPPSPTTCASELLSLSGNHQNISKEQILARILNRFDEYYEELLSSGDFSTLLPVYTSQWMHTNQLVDIEIQPEHIVRCYLLTLSSTGYLLAKKPDNTFLELEPDGNSFDMMKNLIHRKVQVTN